jgi:hypothetical protein
MDLLSFGKRLSIRWIILFREIQNHHVFKINSLIHLVFHTPKSEREKGKIDDTTSTRRRQTHKPFISDSSYFPSNSILPFSNIESTYFITTIIWGPCQRTALLQY